MKVVIGLLVVVGPACGDDDDSSTESTTTTPSDPVDASTTTIADPLGDEPPFLEDAPSGSGCSPGDGADLPDGWWYGVIADPPGASVDFDLACYYVGAAAEEIAAERGDEVNNDYYVVNDDDAVRTLSVGADATAVCVELAGELSSVDCGPSEVDGEWAAWLRVQSGVVDRIVEQYAP